jgi:ligand-binding sensor domain-containing protein/signal transduction histidine kinase
MIRSLILILLLSGLIGVQSLVYSQLNPMNLTQYSETDGNNINDIISDQYGFIWLATENGLIRFDGYEFTRYYNDPNDSTSISQILIHSLFEDSKGRIWIGSVEDINVYHPSTGSFISYPFGDIVGLSEQDLPIITTITENPNGKIYFGVQSYYGIPIDQGLLYYDEVNDSVHKVSEFVLENVHEIISSTSDPFGNSWFTGLRTIVRIDRDGKTENVNLPPLFNEEPNQNPVIHSDDDGMIWMSFEQSILHKYNPETGTYVEFRLNNFTDTDYDEIIVLNIHSDSQNRIWLATDKGLFLFDESRSVLTGFSENTDNSLQESIVSSLNFDAFGNIWIGTYSNGLLKYEEKSYFRSVRSSLNVNSEITPGWVNVFFETSDGSIWFPTDGFGNQSGLNKMDHQTGLITSHPYSELLDNLFGINDIDPLTDTTFILTTYIGLLNLNKESMNINRVETPGIPDSMSVFNSYHRDRLGTEWIGTAFGLFERRSRQAHFTHHDLSKMEDSSPISNEVMHIVESDLHGIWFLTNFGLFSADPETGKMTRHGYDQTAGDVFISQDMNAIFDDNNGTVWIGTWQGGFSRYHPETGEIKNYTRSDGLPSMGIQYILHDSEQNELWLSTFEGISRFSISTEEFINFTTDDGLHSQLFADGSGLKTRDGQFFFGGSGGYTFFNPGDVVQNSIPPAVSLTGISASNQKLEFENGIQQAERIALKYNENTISIGFAAIHYSNPNRNKVRYILKNYDSEWHESGNQRFAYYSNVPPGTYHFEVIAANSNGIWNNEGAAIEIQILPPWWRTWIAYGFYVLLFLSGIYSIDRYQTKRLLQKERERTRENELEQAKEIEKAYHNLEVAHENLKDAQDQLIQQEKLASLGQLTAGIAHEIKNPLNFVNNFSELSVELIEEAREEVKEKLTADSHQLTAILDDIEANLRKIHEHGSRADSIVKSMLQHSRGGDGKMEPTDLNSLVKEYVNLAFHGMRAGKEPIDVDINLQLDESIGEYRWLLRIFRG